MHRVQSPPSCGCQPALAAGLLRRHLLGASLLGGLSAMAGTAAACAPEVLAQAANVAAPSDVCMECLARRAQQRSAFVNKERS